MSLPGKLPLNLLSRLVYKKTKNFQNLEKVGNLESLMSHLSSYNPSLNCLSLGVHFPAAVKNICFLLRKIF